MLKSVILAMMLVESSGDPLAHNPVCGGAGILGITEVMVEEVNRLLGHEEFTLACRWCPVRSEQMAVIFADRHGYSPEEFARRWNAGSAWQGSQAAAYWNRVQNARKEMQK